MTCNASSEHRDDDDDEAKADAWDKATFPVDEETPGKPVESASEPRPNDAESCASGTSTPSPPPAAHVPLEMPTAAPAPPTASASAATSRPSVTAPSRDDPPKTLAEVFLAGQEKPKFPTRLVSAAAIFTGIFVAAALVGHAISNLALPDVKLPSLESLVAKPEVSRRDEWLKDALAGKLEEQQWDLLPMVGKETPTQSAAKALPATLGKAGARARQAAKPAPARVAPSPMAIEAEDDTDPVFAELFGSAGRYEAASKYPSVRLNPAASSGRSGADVRGKILVASLLDEVSSDTVGAPVVAVLSRAVKVGQQVWPARTEIHGEVAGHTDTRIFVNFAFARFEDKATVSLSGRARDAGGRSGIPGKKLFTRQSAGSIGVSAGTKMMQQIGRELAGPAGSILGAGIAGAGDSASEKAQRADRDEYVVLVAAGTRFSIYLESLGGDGSS